MFLSINHVTSYAYAKEVLLQPHTLRLTPRSDSYRRMLERTLTVIPEPDGISQALDVHGSLCQTVRFNRPTAALTVISKSVLDVNDINPFDFVVSPTECAYLPMSYPENMTTFLLPYMGKELVDEAVREYAGQVLKMTHFSVIEFVLSLAQKIAHEFVYEQRKTGLPLPAEIVLKNRSGSCRDFTVFFIAAARSVGLAARFVSGYYFDDSPKRPQLHAWAEVFVPGGGWRGFDPTLGLACYGHHIALASGASPYEAATIEGKFIGEPSSSMDVQLEYEYFRNFSKTANLS